MRQRELKTVEVATSVADSTADAVPSVGLEAEVATNVSAREEAKVDSDGSVKITIEKEAADLLKELVLRVNNGFDAGHVHRQDIASWIITRFMSMVTEADINQIRLSHYSDEAMFEAQYRKMKETGAVPDFLRDAMRKQFEVRADAPKKAKKPLTSKYINDVHSKNGDAA